LRSDAVDLGWQRSNLDWQSGTEQFCSMTRHFRTATLVAQQTLPSVGLGRHSPWVRRSARGLQIGHGNDVPPCRQELRLQHPNEVLLPGVHVALPVAAFGAWLRGEFVLLVTVQTDEQDI